MAFGNSVQHDVQEKKKQKIRIIYECFSWICPGFMIYYKKYAGKVMQIERIVGEDQGSADIGTADHCHRIYFRADTFF
jgi:hypothetical protein